jgi:hypothetical protein
MSAAPTAPIVAHPHLDVRLDVAWTVSCRALGTAQGYQSAVLHAEFAWVGAAESWHPVRAVVNLESGARTTRIELAPPVSARVVVRGAWAHLELQSAGSPLLVASFEHGRLAYCVGRLPALAGLRGGTYDTPTGLLDAIPVAATPLGRAAATGQAPAGPG